MVLPSPLFALERHHIVQRLLLTIADIQSMSDRYAPRPEHRFSFGLWTSAIVVAIRSATSFGTPSHRMTPSPCWRRSGRGGATCTNNDLVPIDATPAERDRIVGEFTRARQHHGIVVPMATVNLFYDPVFRDGVHRERPARARLRRSEDDARDTLKLFVG
jgi:xylose isomerase